MSNLNQALRNASVNGVISLASAEKIAAKFEEQQAQGITLLKAFKQNTGVYYGEQIDQHLAAVEGRHFNAKEYDMRDVNGEQGV